MFKALHFPPVFILCYNLLVYYRALPHILCDAHIFSSYHSSYPLNVSPMFFPKYQDLMETELSHNIKYFSVLMKSLKLKDFYLRILGCARVFSFLLDMSIVWVFKYLIQFVFHAIPCILLVLTNCLLFVTRDSYVSYNLDLYFSFQWLCLQKKNFKHVIQSIWIKFES
jgi:hypothetical protein